MIMTVIITITIIIILIILLIIVMMLIMTPNAPRGLVQLFSPSSLLSPSQASISGS